MIKMYYAILANDFYKSFDKKEECEQWVDFADERSVKNGVTKENAFFNRTICSEMLNMYLDNKVKYPHNFIKLEKNTYTDTRNVDVLENSLKESFPMFILKKKTGIDFSAGIGIRNQLELIQSLKVTDVQKLQKKRIFLPSAKRFFAIFGDSVFKMFDTDESRNEWVNFKDNDSLQNRISRNNALISRIGCSQEYDDCLTNKVLRGQIRLVEGFYTDSFCEKYNGGIENSYPVFVAKQTHGCNFLDNIPKNQWFFWLQNFKK